MGWKNALFSVYSILSSFATLELARYNYAAGFDRLDWWFIIDTFCICVFDVVNSKTRTRKYWHTRRIRKKLKIMSDHNVIFVRCECFFRRTCRSRPLIFVSNEKQFIIPLTRRKSQRTRVISGRSVDRKPSIFLILRRTEFSLSAGAVQRKVFKQRKLPRNAIVQTLSNKSSTAETLLS